MTKHTDIIPESRRTTFGAGGLTISAVGAVCFCIILFWVVITLVGPWLAPYPIGKIVSMDVFTSPSRDYPLGTDYLGRDMLSRIILGARYTVGVSIAAAFIACTIGVALGMISAVLGGWFDTIVSRGIDALIAIPHLMFGLVIIAAIGSSLPVLVGTLAFLYFPGSFRIARALAVNINELDFVQVAKARGEGFVYTVREEILPNMIGPVLADFGLRFVFIVLLLSGLSFLGLGVQPPNADWGALVRENVSGLAYGAPAVIMPSLAIASLTISVNLAIDNLPRRLRDRLP
ncbi:ABC transporter permease [Mesorhizobium sp. M0622]|uniref:ABC transporter permease n=1 Tax=unclassified Mesorhizobium TaxID=325217 RepID=UPI0033381382